MKKPVAEMTRGELADEYGPLTAKLKPLEKKAEELKEEFAKRGGNLFLGEAFSVQRSESSFSGVDVKAAKAALGAEWCAKHSVPVTRTSWKAAALTAADKAGEADAE